MKIDKALKLVAEFKGTNLRENLGIIKSELIGNSHFEIPDYKQLFEAALTVKKISAQIDEIVHATGIINCLSKILEPDEVIDNLSLASGAEGEGIDLVTNKRIAEFKFSIWQSKGNGMRKRQVFADLANLFMYETNKRKELYVVGASVIEKHFNSKRATWKNALSKSGGLDKKLEDYLLMQNISGESLYHVFSISNVKIIDVETVLAK